MIYGARVVKEWRNRCTILTCDRDEVTELHVCSDDGAERNRRSSTTRGATLHGNCTGKFSVCLSTWQASSTENCAADNSIVPAPQAREVCPRHEEERIEQTPSTGRSHNRSQGAGITVLPLDLPAMATFLVPDVLGCQGPLSPVCRAAPKFTATAGLVSKRRPARDGLRHFSFQPLPLRFSRPSPTVAPPTIAVHVETRDAPKWNVEVRVFRTWLAGLFWVFEDEVTWSDRPPSTAADVFHQALLPPPLNSQPRRGRCRTWRTYWQSATHVAWDSSPVCATKAHTVP